MKKAFVILSGIILPEVVLAHSFGQLYSLPVPFWIYVYGATLAMILSFLVIGYFFSVQGESAIIGKRIDLSRFSLFRFLVNSRFLNILKFFSLGLLALSILSGFFGEDSSYSNINMTLFWIFFVLGLTYLTALIGNIYSFINPWKTITRLLVGKEEKSFFKYPKSFGYYPALVFYFIFIWIELMGNNSPYKLSIILFVYTVLNYFGVLALGKEIWFQYCEFFSVFFRLIGKISPFEYKSGKLFIRAPFRRLQGTAESFSLLLFIFFMLSSTAFDGWKETLLWSRGYWTYLDSFFRPIFSNYSYTAFETIGLLFFLILFLLIYFIFIYFSKLIAQSPISTKNLMLEFAYSLIPIAFVYNIAHYYNLVFTEGPNIVRLISDPFGLGYNYFHTAGFSRRVILGANFVWHSQVAIILLGHIVAVYLSHRVAQNLFRTSKHAFLSQLPMLLLMIVYTVFGLWILSQPV